MISKYAVHLAEKLYENNLISAGDRDLYTYGFFLLISKVFFFVVSVLFGILWNIMWQSILFYMAFSILRQYAGGYHAAKESICMLTTSILLFTCISAIKIAEIFSNIIVELLCLVLSYILISCLSPIDTVSKPLNKAEKRHYRAVSSFIMGIFILIASTAVIFQWHDIVHILSVCSTMECILLIMGYKNQAVYQDA